MIDEIDPQLALDLGHHHERALRRGHHFFLFVDRESSPLARGRKGQVGGPDLHFPLALSFSTIPMMCNPIRSDLIQLHRTTGAQSKEVP